VLHAPQETGDEICVTVNRKSDVLADRPQPQLRLFSFLKCGLYPGVYTLHISIPSTDASTCEEIRSVILADCVSIVC